MTLSLEKYISDLARRYNLIVDNVQWADIPIPVAMEHECVKAVVSDAEAAECTEVYGIHFSPAASSSWQRSGDLT